MSRLLHPVDPDLPRHRRCNQGTAAFVLLCLADMRSNGAESGGLGGALVEAMSNAVQLQFGVFVSIAGAILLIVSAIQTPKIVQSDA